MVNGKRRRETFASASFARRWLQDIRAKAHVGQLETFSRTVDFEVFRPDLDKALAYAYRSKGGRPPFDPVLMFKILVIQTLNNLSDERTEYQINDRLSFMRFLSLGLSDREPMPKRPGGFAKA